MEKFNRVYRLIFNLYEISSPLSGQSLTLKESFEITDPITVQFVVKRGINKGVNTADFTLYGLNENTRAKLYKDRKVEKTLIGVQFYGGYQQKNNELSLMFAGTIQECVSYKKSGDTLYTTQIEATDGAYDMNVCSSNKTFSKEMDHYTLIKHLVSDFKLLSLGGISSHLSDIIPQNNRPLSFIGQTYEELKSFVNGHIFIDCQKIYVMADNDVRVGLINQLSAQSSSGLRSVPQRRETIMDVEMMFEPRLVLGQQINLVSSEIPYLNACFKVLSLEHTGIISGAVAGQAVTLLSVQMLSESFQPIQEYTL